MLKKISKKEFSMKIEEYYKFKGFFYNFSFFLDFLDFS